MNSFKEMTKEFGIKDSGLRCSRCGYSLANFEVSLGFSICCDCQHEMDMAEDWSDFED
jgi:hypothetical protein